MSNEDAESVEAENVGVVAFARFVGGMVEVEGKDDASHKEESEDSPKGLTPGGEVIEAEETEEEGEEVGIGKFWLFLACRGLLCNRKRLGFHPHRGPCPPPGHFWGVKWEVGSSSGTHVIAVNGSPAGPKSRETPGGFSRLPAPSPSPPPLAYSRTFLSFSFLCCLMGVLVFSSSGSSENEMKDQVWKSGWRVLMLTK
jgi:hypothetical protein